MKELAQQPAVFLRMIDRDGEGLAMSRDTLRLAQIIGQSALRLWPDLPREMQERLFEGAVGADPTTRHQLATYLHDHHPRTQHPPKPTAFA